MKIFVKAIIGALSLASAASVTATPATAQVGFGIYFGTAPGAVYSPCQRLYRLRPPYCHYPVYHGSVFFGGHWYNGSHHYRMYRGQRQYWFNNGWRGGAIHLGHRNFGQHFIGHNIRISASTISASTISSSAISATVARDAAGTKAFAFQTLKVAKR